MAKTRVLMDINPVKGIASEMDARAYLQQRGIQALQRIAGYIAPVGDGFSDRGLQRLDNHIGYRIFINTDMCFECTHNINLWLTANKITHVYVRSTNIKYMEQCPYCDFVEYIPF